MKIKRRLMITMGKARRILGMLIDSSEAFDDNPIYRYQIIYKIIKERY
jgi:hypothetical protein